MPRRCSPAPLLALASLVLALVLGTALERRPAAAPEAKASPGALPSSPGLKRDPRRYVVAGPDGSRKVLSLEWPLWTLHAPPAGSELTLPAGSELVDLDLDPTGRFAALILRDRASRGTSLHAWDLRALRPLVLPEAAGRSLVALAFSRFGGGLYLISQRGKEWRLELFAHSGDQLAKPRLVHRSPRRLERLVVPPLLYDGQERVFFGREHRPGRFQILSARHDGTLLYEVTSPSGKAGSLTAAELRSRPAAGPSSDRDTKVQPEVLAAPSALPLAIHPFDGTLIWQGADGSLGERSYTRDQNWGKSRKLAAGKGTVLGFSPNGYFRWSWVEAGSGVELQRPDGKAVETIGRDLRFTRPPVLAPNGRGLVGAVRAGSGEKLVALPLRAPLAAVRFLPDLKLRPEALEALGRQGLLLAPTSASFIYGPYESLEYDECHAEVKVPIFASLDGFLEVLQAGFQADFIGGEQTESIPKLRRFATLLEATAKKSSLSRVAEIAQTTLRALRGDYRGAEGKLLLGRGSGPSRLHTVPAPVQLDANDLRPRGPYEATAALQHYFRAFKYINLLQLTREELAALQGDAELQQAWRAWVDVQAPYVAPSRHPLLLGQAKREAPPVLAGCLPSGVKGRPLVYPLGWGLDSEIFERSVDRTDVPDTCAVRGRLLPSGLDLMSVLGSPEAAAIQQPEYARFPALRAMHERLRKTRVGPFDDRKVHEAWLHLVQMIGGSSHLPEGVVARLWRRRLLQTALASWTSYRHTTVLVNEEFSAECDGGPGGFEVLDREPVRGAVDPLPQAWRQLAALLTRLSADGKRVWPKRRVGEVLATAARDAASFGRMAERQLKGEPLSAADYAAIQVFARTVEHPYLLLRAALFKEGEVRPDPMMKIVSVGNAPGPRYLQMAVGNPLAITVLLGDRGLLTPVSGAVYSYYEVVGDKRLTDREWRQRVKTEPRPPWVDLGTQLKHKR